MLTTRHSRISREAFSIGPNQKGPCDSVVTLLEQHSATSYCLSRVILTVRQNVERILTICVSSTHLNFLK